jgi:Zn ribbon nucleic-acid-binding protein
MFRWKIEVNGQRFFVEAGKLHTALGRVTGNCRDISGTIVFQRLENIKRIKCLVCGHTYQDNPTSKKHHFENFFFHKETEKKAEAEKNV